MSFGQKFKNIYQNGNFTLSSTEMFKNNKNMLMRDYINIKLYSKEEGYYSNNKEPIGRLDKPINFTMMRGLSDYTVEMNKIYQKTPWLTPSELLRPYYGYTLGNYILTQFLKFDIKVQEQGIKIVEVGFGRGGAIDSILDYFRKFSVKNYRNIEYVGFEINNNFYEQTTELLKKNHPELYKNNQIQLINNSFFRNLNETSPIDNDCFLLALNFLNSTTHDRILVDKKFSSRIKNEIESITFLNNPNESLHKKIVTYYVDRLIKNNDLIKQTHIINDSGILKQELVNLNDRSIAEIVFYYYISSFENFRSLLLGDQFMGLENARKRDEWFIQLLKSFYNKGNYIWLPTEAIKFFETVNKIFPKHHLIFNDLDFLPTKIFGSDYSGINAPSVFSDKPNSVDSITHKSIFANLNSEKMTVNINFPIHFEMLQMIYKIITGRNSTINKFTYFNNEFSLDEWCETKSGFNPLLDSHKNMSYLLTLI